MFSFRNAKTFELLGGRSSSSVVLENLAPLEMHASPVTQDKVLPSTEISTWAHA